ncbi:hypothetical protein LUZ60_016359 [Juncus effusus]|nr:hypothetical protein LUZ60_016359 [Juncus effusus]
MDWSSLPPDLLRIISKNLSNISDFIRFRSVCKAWLAASPLSDPPSQIPWLLEKKDWRGSALRFYSLSSSPSGEVITVQVPSSAGRWVDGPSHGYLLSYLPGSLGYRLINPLTDEEIELPNLDLKRPRVVLTGPDPVQSENYVVALCGNSVHPKVSFSAVFQFRNMKWMEIYELSSWGCYCDGKYISMNRVTGNVQIFDVTSQKMVCYEIERPTQMRGFQYLVYSSEGILRVNYYDDKLLPLDQCKFEIHKLDFGTGNDKPDWTRMKSIRDQMLFLDKSNGFSVSASHFGGFRGNCIYFLKEKENEDSFGCNYSLCRYEIESERAEELSCPFVKGGTWFVPSLRSNF